MGNAISFPRNNNSFHRNIICLLQIATRHSDRHLLHIASSHSDLLEIATSHSDPSYKRFRKHCGNRGVKIRNV